MQRLPTTPKFDNQSLSPAPATCPCGSVEGWAPPRPSVSQAVGGLVLWGAGSPETRVLVFATASLQRAGGPRTKLALSGP